MKTTKVKIENVREWFKKLSFNEKCEFSLKYFSHRNFNLITDNNLKSYFIKEHEN